MKPTTPHVKGTDLVTIKKMLTQAGDETLQTFSHMLSQEAKYSFDRIMATMWVPNPVATEIMECAARTLFPNTQDDLEQLGAACAQKAFSGIYKTFLRMTTIPFLLKHVPMVWTMYHSVGRAEVTPHEDHAGATLKVFGAPDVMVNNLRLVGGFSAHALGMAGARQVTFSLNTANPDEWVWTFHWLA